MFWSIAGRAGGIVQSRIGITWTASTDPSVVEYQFQIQPVGSVTWTDAGYALASSSQFYIPGVVSAQTYNVQMRGLRKNTAASAWVTVNGYQTSDTLSNIVATSALTAQSATSAETNVNAQNATVVGGVTITNQPTSAGQKLTVVSESGGTITAQWEWKPEKK